MKKKRIIAFLKGGLGNQCFIYAAAKTLSDRTGAQLCFSLDYFPGDKIYRRNYDLGCFKVSGEILPMNGWIVRQFEEFRYKVCRKLCKDRIGNFCLDHPPFTYVPFPDDWDGDLLLDGYWHAFGYYKDSMPGIYDDFELSGDDAWLTNDCLYREIKANDKSFFCHVRSYKEVPGHANGDMSAKIGYYEKALRLMHERLGADSTCYLFSDDLEWARERLAPIVAETGQKVVPVEAEPGVNDQLRDFMLMRACSNGIVGNSSFSGFAGVLADCGVQKHGRRGVFIYPVNEFPWAYFPDYWRSL